jgi:hypothetical protein
MIVDLTAVTFCWVRGLALLAETAAIAGRHVDLLWGTPSPPPTEARRIAPIASARPSLPGRPAAVLLGCFP